MNPLAVLIAAVAVLIIFYGLFYWPQPGQRSQPPPRYIEPLDDGYMTYGELLFICAASLVALFLFSYPAIAQAAGVGR